MTQAGARHFDLLTVVLAAAGLGLAGVGVWYFLHRDAASGAGADAASSAASAAPKPELRMVPPEVYMRSYLDLFGGLAPLEVQQRARGPEGLFDTWDDYVSSLGFPDYKMDVPRQSQTNALMMATFERLGIALCDRSIEHDLEGSVPIDKRVVFAFDVPSHALDLAAFSTRFDSLHRLFLGYPAALAPTARTSRFFDLYKAILAERASAGAPKSKFLPEHAGWAAVCYGLVRHPEFHHY